MNTLKLKNPIKIDGKDVSELTYDSNEIDGLLFAEAEASRKDAAGKRMSAAPVVEVDFSLHLYMGYAAIIAANRNYAFSDLERIKGTDVLDVMKIGRNFIMKSETEQQESDSDEPSETTQESTIPAPANSKEKE